MQVEIWTAFSGDASGGSPAGIVLECAGMSASDMQAIAARVGAPATGFVTGIDRQEVNVRFFSTKTEYGMCGHGTIALLTSLIENDLVETGPVAIRTGQGEGVARIELDAGGRHQVQLDLDVAGTAPCREDLSLVWKALGAAPRPAAISQSDFTHLLVPMPLAEVSALSPDFAELGNACRRAGIDTVASYAIETLHDDAEIHVRDFCPAVGTDEAAATGTTNRAVISHLVAENPGRYGTGVHRLTVEQGIEMGKPSRILV